MNNKWWGYLHVENSLHVKVYFSEEDIKEAKESPFVKHIAGPWECDGREEALEKLKASIKNDFIIW